MMRLKKWSFFLSVLLLYGCTFDFEKPVVISATPCNYEIFVSRDSEITVNFSAAMDTMKTVNEFSLSSPSGQVNGFFSWNSGNRTLVFKPETPLERASKYTICISDDAEDSSGNDLEEEYVSVFYTGGDDIPPAIDWYMPEENTTGNAANTAVRIRFTEAMDTGTVYDGISISPPVEGFFSWDEGDTLAVFTPLKQFSYGVTYSIKVKSSMRDAAGNSLADEKAFSFTVGDDFTPPYLSVYQDNAPILVFDENFQNTGAEKDRDIVIEFSELVDTDCIIDALSISPSAEYYISTETVVAGDAEYIRAVIHFTGSLRCEDTYTLKIGSSITDLQNNRLVKDYRYVFVTDGTESHALTVINAGDLTVAAITTPWPVGSIPLLTIGGTDKFYFNIGIEFSSPVNPLTLDMTVDLLTSPGNTGSIVNIDWPSSAANGNFSLLSFGLYNVSQFNTYRITVKGGANGLKDMNGNYMKEDFVQIVRFQ